MDSKANIIASTTTTATKANTGARTTILLQDECYRHRYIRSKDDSFIVERPERLRALKLGFSAAISRLEERNRLRELQRMKPQTKMDLPAENAVLDVKMEGLTITNSHSHLLGVEVLGDNAESAEPSSTSETTSANDVAVENSAPIEPRISAVETEELTRALDKLDIGATGTGTATTTATDSVIAFIRPAGSAPSKTPKVPTTNVTDDNELTHICDVSRPKVRLQYLSSHPAVRMIHAAGDDGGFNNLEHLDKLAKWSRGSEEKVIRGESEIPPGYLQGDLYMCPQSYSAICGAVETVCDAVDTVMDKHIEEGVPRPRRAFAAIRPPGHHCGEDTPSGFCFVNNVAIGAAHAYLKYGINRVIIFDIDLHHGKHHDTVPFSTYPYRSRDGLLSNWLGNGTQAVAWSINAETHRQRLAQEAKGLAMDSLESGGSDSRPSKGDEKNERPGLQIFYASIHDILSYPCEDGVAELVQAASVSISGQHGQFIENIHLQPYSTHEEFWEKLYTQRYSKIFDKAKAFLQSQPENTGDNHANKVGTGWDRNVPIFISCGFDASELEYESMSRHGRKVPVGFYYRFTRDACRFAEEYANGKVVSVLEGGYSDRTLTAGGMAHLVGLVEDDKIEVNEDVNVNPLDISELGGNVRLGETNNEVVREGKLKLEAVSGGPEDWWSDRNLELLEKATKKKKGRVSAAHSRASMGGVNMEPWVERTLEIMAKIDPPMPVIPLPVYKPPPSSSTAVSTSSIKPVSRAQARSNGKPVSQVNSQRQPAPREARERTEKIKAVGPSSQSSSPRKGKVTAATQKVTVPSARPTIKKSTSSMGTKTGSGGNLQKLEHNTHANANDAILDVQGMDKNPSSLDPNANVNVNKNPTGTDGKPEAPPWSGAAVNPTIGANTNRATTANPNSTSNNVTDISNEAKVDRMTSFTNAHASSGQSAGSLAVPTGSSDPQGPPLPQATAPVPVRKLPRIILKVREPGS